MSNLPAPNPDHFGHIEPFPRREVAQAIGAGLTREARRTATLRGSLPAGITIGHRKDGREKPWFVRFGADRLTESFTTEKARNDLAQTLADAVSKEGTGLLDFDPAEWRKVKRFKERTGVSLEEAEEIVMRVKGNLRLNLTAAEAVERYKALRLADGSSLNSHAGLHLDRFVEDYGHLPLFAVTPEHVRTWLASLKGRKFGPVTLRHHRKDLNVFFERALVEKWCIDNPCRAVAPPKVADQTTSILSPKEIFTLLKANVDSPFAGRLALELFGGLRASSCARVIPEDVKPEIRGVLMRGSSVDEDGEWDQGHKSGKRKFRQGHPPVLWAWVKHAKPPAFAATALRTYYWNKTKAFARAGWEKIPHNRLRHCFASYLLAAGAPQHAVSRLMQHTSWKMLERYEGIATENDARLVLSMTPAAVALTWDEFTARWAEFYQPFNTPQK